MKNLDLLSQRILVCAVALAIVLLSASLFVFSLGTITRTQAQEIVKEDDSKKVVEEKKSELTAMNTSQLSVAGTGDGGFVICVGIYDDMVYYISNGKLAKVSLKKNEIIK